MRHVYVSLTSRIWLAGTVAVCLCLAAAMTTGSPLWAAAIAVASSAALRVSLGRFLAPLDALQARMNRVSAETARQEALIRAQNALFNNIGMLRDALYAHGDPRQLGDKLYFGDKLINGSFEEVDFVKSQAGGSATVFLGDLRISTNVTKPDGSRAVGTRLASGAAYDTVLSDRKTFRGEAEILGVPCLTVYEPILSEGAVIGIIYAGVRKDEVVQGAAAGSKRDALTEMRQAVAQFETAAIAKGKAELEAADQRYTMEDARRQNERMRKTASAVQQAIVEALSLALARLSDGDLMHRIEVDFPSEYSKLKADFNSAIEKLRQTMLSIGQGARTMRHNSGEIAHAADDLSRRTERQAASLEETAVALDELTAKVRQSAESAQRAQSLVADARAKAEYSGEVVRKAIAAMGEIDASAKQIAQIMSMIDEIAFQTNLLALNAGVEAARAGESGRGFAVVASEVRALAQRSADAAKQVRTLISTSAVQVDGGVHLVTDTGKALMGIIDSVAEINLVVEGIAVSARDQASGLREVNIAVSDMDKVTQQNAAMVEESTAASQSLAHEAEELVTMVGRFQIEEDTSAARGPLPGRRRAA